MSSASSETTHPVCPKCGYQRRDTDSAPPGECPSCGVIYEKFLARQAQFAAGTRIEGVYTGYAAEPSLRQQLWADLWTLPETVDPVVLGGQLIVWGGSVVWGLWLILHHWNSTAVLESFLHRVNLPFHEFGHLLFRPFGQWMMYLGGSLFQILLPLLIAGYFLWRQRQPFSASVCLWWCAQNFVDVAPYVGDATNMFLPLTGEWSDDIVDVRAYRHDWHNILEPLGWLPYDHRLAVLCKATGVVLMVLAWAWGAMLLRRQWERVQPM